MGEGRNDVRKALGAVLDARCRETHRQSGCPMQHQLIGAFTKRP